MRMLLHASIRILFVLIFGIRVRHKISDLPAIVIANHNTHLDIFALFLLFPLRHIKKVRAVAAADYFGSGFRGAMAKYLFGALLIDRRGGKSARHVLAPVFDALQNGQSLVLFPEGTRGEPGKLQPFKAGIGMIAEAFPHTPIHPVSLRGIERTLPKGKALVVPFSFEIQKLEPIYGKSFTCRDGGDVRQKVTRALEQKIKAAVETS